MAMYLVYYHIVKFEQTEAFINQSKTEKTGQVENINKNDRAKILKT